VCYDHNLEQVRTLLRALSGVTEVVAREVNILKPWFDTLSPPRPLPKACRVPPWNRHPGRTP
jgi:hypothetical protein